MQNKQTPGRGVLYINSRKSAEKQPDYMGELTLDRDYGRGTTLKIAGWRRTTPKNHLIGLSISQTQDRVYPRPVVEEDGDVEIPF